MIKIIKLIITWLGTTKLLSIPRGYVGRSIAKYYASKGTALYNVADYIRQTDPVGIALIKSIRQETEMLLSDEDAYFIYSTVKKAEKIEGEIAEVGTYKGGSTKLICEATKKPIRAFDTFEGLPALHEKDSTDQMEKGEYAASLESVQNYLQNYPNITFYQGLFPATAVPVEDKRFSFVHLDVDLYESTLNCLKFFYPRMSRGGVIISHDRGADGVMKAFNEFFEDKPEIIIEPYLTSQYLIIKV